MTYQTIMKHLLLIIALIIFVACNNQPKKESTRYSKESLDVTTSIYPEKITRVFNAHGGIDNWNKMKSLSFSMEKPSGLEITTTDLKNRKSLIEMPKHTIGYDGEQVWLKSDDTTTYKGNAKFYYNLMFYFYAMPFVLGDDGIAYEDSEPLQIEDKSYPGIKISYETGIGESPEDEYILFYDPETYKMTWLGYTVTYFTQEKGKEFHFIKYSAWQDVDGLLLPKTLSWYNYENNVPTTRRNDLDFIDIKLSKEKPNPEIFVKPEGANVVD